MAISINTTKLSRRSAIAGLAALSTAGAAQALSMPARTLINPDAELIELGRQLELVSAELADAYKRSSIASHAAKSQEPPLPEVLRTRPEDQKVFGLPKPDDKWSPGYYTPFCISDLRNHRPTRQVEMSVKDYCRSFYGPDERIGILLLDSDVVVKSVPWPEAQARNDEIIAAADAWKAECDRIDVACDNEAIEAEIDTLGDRQTELHEAILSQPATTIAGLAVKAKAVKLLHTDDEEIDFGETTDVMLSVSIVADLLAMSA